MQSLQQQRGMTTIGWLLVLVLIVVFSLLTIKVVPLYLNGFRISSALESLKSDPLAHGKSPLELKKLLLNRFDIDMMKGIQPEDITVSRTTNGYTVSVDYQAKELLFGSTYLVVLYEESVDIVSQ